MTNAYQRSKLRHWGAPVPAHLKHGPDTYAKQVYGCDCSSCLPSGRRRAAHGAGTPHAQRQRALRERKKGKPVPAGTRHGIYAYRVYGCPCDICVMANRRARKKARSTWQATATGHWSSSTDTTGAPLDVIHWPPVGYGTWTCPDCGQRFAHRHPTRKEQTLAA